MSYSSHRPLSTYPVSELLARAFYTLAYYAFYLLAYVFYFKPLSLLRPASASSEDRLWFGKYCDHYFPRPEFAYFKAEEGRCFRACVGRLEPPRLEIGYEDGRISSYHTGGLAFDAGLEYDPAVAGVRPPFDHYGRLLTGSFQAMPVPDASFRSLVAIHVMDHFRELDPALSEAARVLAPGGHFAFSLFSARALDLIGQADMSRFDLHNFFDSDEWRRSLRRHGFDLTSTAEFTRSDLYLRIYFLGMKGLIPHDRSLVFRLLQKHLPACFHLLKVWLKDVAFCVYFSRFSRSDDEANVPGCNSFFLARRLP